MPGRSWRAGQPCGDGKPVGPDRSLERESEGLRPLGQSPNEKHGVRGIDVGASEEKKEFSASLSFHYISRLAAANIGCASEKENEFSFSLSFHYICKLK